MTHRSVLQIALALAAASCSGGASGTGERTGERATSRQPSTNAALSVERPASSVHVDGGGSRKEPLAGLVDMQNIAFHNSDDGEPAFVIENVSKWPGIFGGVVVNATWRSIEPKQGGNLDTSSIDAALDKVRAYNAANPSHPIGVKLRVYAGSSAPSWAKSLAGGPVHIERNPKGCANPPCPLTIGKHWTGEYATAWRSFQGRLATKYDDEPLVRQVAVTSCASQTDEPFVSSSEKSSRAALTSAGYDDAAEKKCLMGAIDDYAAWKKTLIDYTINTFSKVEGGVDNEFPLSVMRHCRDVLGARCVLDNHALSSPLRESERDVYDAMKAMKGVVNFQTEAPRGMGCRWRATIAEGVALGAVSIEVWPDEKYQGFLSLTEANVRELAAELTSPIAVPKAEAIEKDCKGFL